MRPRIKMQRVSRGVVIQPQVAMGVNNNLQQFPLVVRTQTYRVTINYPRSQERKWFFKYDGALDGCLIKGIRCETRNGTFNSKDQSQFLTTFKNNLTLGLIVSASLMITLKNSKQEILLDSYPLSALANHRVIRRVNMDLDISKCYIHPSSAPALEESLGNVDVTFYYTPKK